MKNLHIVTFIAFIALASCVKDTSNPNNNNNNKQVNPNKATACFTYGPHPPKAGSYVSFDASCSQKATHFIWAIDRSFIWTDIDGNKSAHIEKTFSEKLDYNTYKITLYAYGDDSTTTLDTVSQFIKMDNSPVACFTLNGSSTAGEAHPVNTPINLNASCSNNMDPQTATWVYDGHEPSGSDNYGVQVSHTFTTTGSHTINLSVTDPSRTGSNNITKTITIY